MNRDLAGRLSALRLAVPAEAAVRHQAAIAAALAEPLPSPSPPRRRRRVLLAAAAAGLALLLPAAALAAEGALPGDPLYPLKRITETVRSPFDTAVAARHRIEELEAAVVRGAPDAIVQERLDAAERATAALDDALELRRRLAAVRERIRAEAAADASAESGGPVAPPSRGDRQDGTEQPPARTEPAPADTTTPTTVIDRGDDTTTTTTTTTTMPPPDRRGDGERDAP